jgi:hypothetical protein
MINTAQNLTNSPKADKPYENIVSTTLNKEAQAGVALIAKIFSMPQYGNGLTLASPEAFLEAFEANSLREKALKNRGSAPENTEQFLPGYFIAVGMKNGQALSTATCSLVSQLDEKTKERTWSIIVGYAAVDKDNPEFKKEFALRAGNREDPLSIQAVKAVVEKASRYCFENYGVKPKLASCEAAFDSYRLWGRKLEGSGMIVMTQEDGKLRPFSYMSPPFNWDDKGRPVIPDRTLIDRKGNEVPIQSLVCERDIIIDGKQVRMPGIKEVYGVLPISFDKDNVDSKAVKQSVEAFIYTYFLQGKEYFLKQIEEKKGDRILDILRRQRPEFSDEIRAAARNTIIDRLADRALLTHQKYLGGLTASFNEELSRGNMQILSIREYNKAFNRKLN